MADMEQIDEKSLDFTTELYALYTGEQSKGHDMYEVGKKANCDRAETEYIVEHLSKAGVINYERSSGKVSMTSKGIEMVKNRTIRYGTSRESFKTHL